MLDTVVPAVTMKNCALVLLLLGCVYAAPVEDGALEQVSCEDPQAKFNAELALTKINQDRDEGYILSLHRLSNVHIKKHHDTGFVFYLTLDVFETNCSVLSRKDWKTCTARSDGETPIYGQCKVALYINRPHRVARLYKYSCTTRPVPLARIHKICPDCPSSVDFENPEVKNLVSESLEKFNKESTVDKRFALLKVERATVGMAMSMYYHVDYSIQETTCSKTAAADNCPFMTCEFTHKGFCKASAYRNPTGEVVTTVDCEIYEPEAAEREKIRHMKADTEDHDHSDTANHNHDHDQPHEADATHTHDHTHNHNAGSGHSHGHSHSHDHAHGPDHAHAHHAKAHNHDGDAPHQHHKYKHPDGLHTHEHDHEIALDHDHKHGHMHHHEHHHHHHDHQEDVHDHPEGSFVRLPSLDKPMTLPSFPDVPAASQGVTLPAKPDPQIPGVMEPVIEAFPASISAQCTPPIVGSTLAEQLLSEDPMFQQA